MRSEDHELLRRVEARAAEGPDGRGGAVDEVERLAALWAALDPPAAEPAPPGFAGRVLARVREEHAAGDPLARRFGRLPARWAAASALSAGLVAGAALGALLAPAGLPGPAATVAERPAAPAPGATATDDGTAAAPPSPAAAVGDAEVESLVAEAVAAAGDDAAVEPPDAADALFAAETALADDYLAALAALEEAS